MDIRVFTSADHRRVIEIWHLCDLVRPQNDPDKDIDDKVRHDPSSFLVADSDGEIVATVMFGYDGHRGSVNYLGVDPKFARRGIGTRLMDEVERRLGELGCPKVNLQVRVSNEDTVAFYQQRGYSVDSVISLGKRLGTVPST